MGAIVIENIYKMFIKPRLEKIKNKPKDAEIIFDIIEEYLKEWGVGGMPDKRN